jgi:signal transduction histidine kinase
MSETFPELPLEQVFRRNIYLTVKEAVHNIVRHANATEVNIAIQLINNELIISIKDNGTGINAEEQKRFGNGLKNMQQRMTQIRGTFEIKNNGGTCVVLRAFLNPVKKG